MAALLTVLSIVLGIVLGLSHGGRFDQVLGFRPAIWQAGAAGIALQGLIWITNMSGSWAVVFELLSAVALLVFCVSNIRIGGMVVVVAGLVLNFVPTLLNWGTPTSARALERAGLIDASDLATPTAIELSGPRHIAGDGDWLRFLGEIIAVPTGNVISFGDGLLHIGYILVIAAVLRGRVVGEDALPDLSRLISR